MVKNIKEEHDINEILEPERQNSFHYAIHLDLHVQVFFIEYYPDISLKIDKKHSTQHEDVIKW